MIAHAAQAAREMHDSRIMRRWWIVLAIAGCATESATQAVSADPDEAGDADGGKEDGTGGVPDVHCAGTPATGDAAGFRHTATKIAAALGDPVHRGIDLIATADDETQVIEAELSFGATDKAAEDEDVDLFACRHGAWEQLGTARTDGEGHARLSLAGSARLPLGLRDMYASAVGDRSGAPFVALVSPAGSPLAVSDIDGTLTSSENAFAATLLLGADIGVHPGAPDVFQSLARRGYQPVYVTARARTTTQITRDWLARVGLPRGPVRLAAHLLLPGDATIAYKTDTLTALAGFELALGNGNRASDITAYTAAGVPADRITIKLPEFTDEVASSLAAGDARGFTEYTELGAMLATLPGR